MTLLAFEPIGVGRVADGGAFVAVVLLALLLLASRRRGA